MPSKRETARTLAGLVAALLAATAAASDHSHELFREDFEHGLGDRWQEQGFPSIDRKNHFSLAEEADGNHYLKVESRDSYSGKGVYLSFAVGRCPEVRWRWRVSDVIEAADIRGKEGDDVAARLYVVFDGPSRWNPLDKRLLIYVWDKSSPVGTVQPNAWMPDTARMIVLESGRTRVGQWVPEQVDLAADFARAFPGTVAGTVEGVAFLADTDNTHASVEAGIDDIVIRCPDGDEPRRR